MRSVTPSRRSNDRGSVLVLVAIAIFPIAALLTFAIDISHYFDYSRNLQNRADAAAFAAGTAYGNICFTSPGSDPWNPPLSTIGEWAQLYTGTQIGEPSDEGANPAANVPFSDANVFGTTGATDYYNQPNLKLGSVDDYYVLLNANNYFDKGGTNFAMGNPCSADPALDETDKHPGKPGALTDVKVTQMQLPNFIPLFNVHPNIEAHARVELQKVQSEKTRPIAVSDASEIPCVTANFLDADGDVIASEKLTRVMDTTTDPATPTPEWTTAPGDGASVSMASGDPVTVQLFLNNCSTTSPTGLKYNYFDGSGHNQQLGLVYINNWGSPGSPTTPEIIAGGVTLTGANGGPCDPYFQTSTGSCLVGVTAHIGFATPPPSGVSYDFRAVDGTDPTTNFKTLDNGGGGTTYTSASSFSFASDSGPHPIHVIYAQLGGKVGTHTCNTSGDPWAASNKNCRVDLGVQQRAFSGINGTNACNNPPYDTGPMQWITVGDAPGGLGANAFGAGDNPTLYVTTYIVGLKNAGDTDPPICLRVAESTSHSTGFIDCGQGNATGADQDALQYGCPNPVQIDTVVGADGALSCTPALDPVGCVPNNPGESPPVLRGLDALIGNPAPGNCETNYWPAATGRDTTHTIEVGKDKRALVMIITAPTDVWNTTGSSSLIPIRNFAVFYVTGWSTLTGGVKGCTNNDPPPPGAGNGEIWGHWTSVAIPSGLGSGSGEQCNFTLFGNCIAVLTR
jgi:hypothetical protein